MRNSLILLAAIMIATPVAFTGCDRTASTETVHKDVDADGAAKETVKKTTANLDTGATHTETAA